MTPRISWVALFVKAYGLLAADIVELRQSYMCWPWPHIFQHEHSVAMVAVNRSTPTGDRLFWGRFTAPEKQTLIEIQTQLDDYKHGQIEKTFRRQMRVSKFPTPLRRLAWWMSLNLSAVRRRAPDRNVWPFDRGQFGSRQPVSSDMHHQQPFLRPAHRGRPHAGDDRLRSSHDRRRPFGPRAGRTGSDSARPDRRRIGRAEAARLGSVIALRQLTRRR